MSSEGKQVYKEHCDEIQRRRAAVERDAALDGSALWLRGNVFDMGSLRCDDQHVVLYSLSQSGFSPVRREHSALRLYGVFACRAEASAHACRVLEQDHTLSMFVSDCCTWLLAAEDETRYEHREAITREKLQAYVARCEADRNDAKAPRPPPPEPGSDEDEAPEEATARASTAHAPDPPRAAAAPLTAAAQTIGQRFAVLTCIVDDTQEFLFNVLGAFDTLPEANEYVNESLGPRYDCTHVDVVAMYRWIYPTRMRGQDAPQLKETFRHAELDSVMRYHKNEPKRVQEYKDWRAEHKLGDDDVANSVTALEGGTAFAPSC